MSSAIDNNLAILLLGMSMSGGLAYGGYRVFKDNPRPALELLKMKMKVILDRDGDVEQWKAGWSKYIEKNTTLVQEESTTQTSPDVARRTPKISEKDIWEIEGWAHSSKQKDVVPEGFKNACENKASAKFSGTWADDYLNFEKFCTKDAEEEE